MRPVGLALLLALLVASPGHGAEKEELKRLLSSRVPTQREEGIAALGKTQNTTTAKQLIKYVNDPDWGVQMAAMRALAPIQFGPGRDAIRKMIFTGETLSVRTLAAELLRDHAGKETAAKLKRSVFKYKKRARLPGIHALGIIGTEDGIVALRKLSKAGDPEHRAAACQALGSLAAGEKDLLRCLKDRKDYVQFRAVLGLAHLDSDRARESALKYVERGVSPYILNRLGRTAAKVNRSAFEKALRRRLDTTRNALPILRVAVAAEAKGCEVLARKHLGNRDPFTRAFALRLLGLGDPEQPWDEIVKLLADRDRRVRYAAAEALLRLGRKKPDETLGLLLGRNEPDIVMMAVRAALDARHKKSVPRLIELAKGTGPAKKDWMLRCSACVAAGWVGGRQSLDALKEVAAERDWRFRGAALEGIFRIYHKDCIPALLKYFDDIHPAVRLTARKNIAYMTQKKYSRKGLFLKWWKKHGDRIELVHPEDAGERLKKEGYHVRRDMIEVLRKTDIVAIKGRWDRVQLILEDLKIKHAAIRAQEIKVYGLNPKQVVLVNCEGSTDSETSRMLQWFVVTGGYMATTDWTIVNALHKTFPNVVAKYGRQTTGNDVVIAEEAVPGHPILNEVFRPYVAPKWWLEIAAFPLEVVDPIRSTVIVDSFEMLRRYKRTALMVVFPYGLGKVMHSASHFYLQTEGLAKETTAKRRKIFAHDHLGMSLAEIRELEMKKYFEDAKDTTPISKSYSMFHMLVNFLQEKRLIDLGK